MLIKVDWYDVERTIIQQIFEGKLTGDDIIQSAEQTDALCKLVNRKTYVISDFSGLKGIPGSILPIIKDIDGKNYKNDTVAFIVAASTYITALGQIVRNLMPNIMTNMYFVATTEDALKKIGQMKVQDRNRS